MSSVRSFSCPPETVFRHVGLRLPDEIFFHQLIELQAADGGERLSGLDPITQLHVNMFDLPADAGGNLGDLLQIECDLAGCGHQFRNGASRGGLGAQPFPDRRRRVNRMGEGGLRRHLDGRGRFRRFRSLLPASGENREDGQDHSGRCAASDHRLLPRCEPGEEAHSEAPTARSNRASAMERSARTCAYSSWVCRYTR